MDGKISATYCQLQGRSLGINETKVLRWYGLRKEKKRLYVCSAYVIPRFRGTGYLLLDPISPGAEPLIKFRRSLDVPRRVRLPNEIRIAASDHSQDGGQNAVGSLDQDAN